MSSNSSKNKTLILIIILLLLTNIAVVGYFLFGCKKANKPPRGKDNFTAVLEKEVGFNKQQLAQFNELKKGHWANAKANMDKIVTIKNTIFDLTKQPNTPDSVVENLADSIGALQKQVEMSAYRHVLATRSICTPQQLAAYDTLMKRLINKGRRNGRPPYDGPPPSKRN